MPESIPRIELVMGYLFFCQRILSNIGTRKNLARLRCGLKQTFQIRQGVELLLTVGGEAV